MHSVIRRLQAAKRVFCACPPASPATCDLNRALVALLLIVGAAHLQAAPAPATANPAAVPQPAGTKTADVPDVAARAAAVAAQTATAAPLAGADCRIDIRGNAKGSISRASMACSGGRVVVGMQPQLLAPFKGNFRGVVQDDECARPWCLIRFCGNTTVGINNSTIEGVMTARAPDLEKVLCIRHSSRVVLRNCVISNNNATAVEVVHDAWLQVLGSTLADNTGDNLSGGISNI